jgi:hypothetical protein
MWREPSHHHCWKVVRAMAGRPGLDFYELRHCAATMLLERGMTPDERSMWREISPRRRGERVAVARRESPVGASGLLHHSGRFAASAGAYCTLNDLARRLRLRAV